MDPFSACLAAGRIPAVAFSRRCVATCSNEAAVFRRLSNGQESLWAAAVLPQQVVQVPLRLLQLPGLRWPVNVSGGFLTLAAELRKVCSSLNAEVLQLTFPAIAIVTKLAITAWQERCPHKGH